MYKLSKKPKKPVILTGFPGFGLVGTIATEFMIEHLKTEQIGKIWLEDVNAVVAIHNEELINPIGIFYNESHNIVIIHGISAEKGADWKIANEIIKVTDDLNAEEIVSLEGVGTVNPSENPKLFFYSSSDEKNGKLKGFGLDPMKEGIVMGVTSALMIKLERPISSLFVESHADIPDNKAAAELIGALDKYLGLDIDMKPLLESAKIFESKLKGLMEKSKEAQDQKEKKMMSYVG